MGERIRFEGGLRRRVCLFVVALAALGAAVPGAQAAPSQPAAAAAPKVLRYVFGVAETGFDPAQVSDTYSRAVTGHIFDAPLTYDYLARPAKLRPNTAASLPEISADFRTFTFRIRPGIYFADDPAFKGRRRELTAEDYVYSIKRIYDPRWKSPSLYALEGSKLVGMNELREQVVKENKPFPYDTEVEGLKALDRYTFRIQLVDPSPRFHLALTDSSILGAVAREVVEAYGDNIMAHPVGTGPFRLVEWRRSSRMVLERNPNFRDEVFDGEPPPDDTRGQEILARLKGRKLPMLDRVEISVITESQPLWLAFLNAEVDLTGVPLEFANIAAPNGELAANLARRGIRMERRAASDVTLSYFQMEHPVVGGYTPEKVALRRAIALAFNTEEEIRVARRGQATVAQSIIPPLTYGYDPDFRSENSEFSRPRAKALLDMYGYVDKNGDGWRDLPDGRPLVLEMGTGSDLLAREFNELWKKNMDAIGVRIVFKVAQWPEQLKMSRAGKLMMWSVGFSATVPDGEDFLASGYGPNKGSGNHARFDLPAFNRLFEQQMVLPDGEQRLALMDQAKKLLIAYMPYKVHVHRIATDLAHPWVIGYRRHPFMREFWRYIDVDMERRAQP
ncbi:ABC transporter substrate-binding protein [Aquabacterium sp. A7-Y]|uniref:ABC transporter substrate-binding protein n=1 Tax=Aquabacterium sp. A7-Y TaxID=1349605 RepID=UPI00223D61F7|nr:ABC transporter substrate-binding protein [Aquabacterium sp. A7-Y]MCW7538499.1 ABC transporter substrate-binding protein [Aquabacterium sp. A7-Y]